MAWIIAHELEEAVTDPDLNAWYDRRGRRTPTSARGRSARRTRAANGSQANMKLGARDYLIQQNWVNAAAAIARELLTGIPQDACAA